MQLALKHGSQTIRNLVPTTVGSQVHLHQEVIGTHLDNVVDYPAAPRSKSVLFTTSTDAQDTPIHRILPTLKGLHEALY